MTVPQVCVFVKPLPRDNRATLIRCRIKAVMTVYIKMADRRIRVSVLEGSFADLQGLVSPCQSASTCNTGTTA